MDKKNYAYGLIILNLILQIASCFWYNKLPGFVWALAGAIVILVPLLYGWQIGLLCLLPLAASELVWFFKLGSFGPLLQLACYTIAFIIMAVAHPRIAKMPQQKRILLSCVLLIAVIAGKALLYQGLRLLVLQKSVNWNTLFSEVLPPVIPVVLIMLVVIFKRKDNES